MLLVTGDKNKNGNLLTIDEIIFWKQDIQQWAALRLDVNYQPLSMSFSSGAKVLFSNYQNSMVELTFFDAQGVEISREFAQLQIAEPGSISASPRQNTYMPDISQEQQWFSSHPKTATLCKQRAEFIKIKELPDFVINIMSFYGTIASGVVAIMAGSPFLGIEIAKMLVSSAGLFPQVSNNPVYKKFAAPAMTADTCLQPSPANALSCATDVVLNWLNERQIQVGEINECEESEKIDAYLYADCGGKTYKTGEKTPTCTIPYGGQIDISIVYYKPQPYSATIEFAETGGPGAIPPEFEVEIPANSTAGTIRYKAKHQVLWKPNLHSCHTTAGDPNDATAPDPGALWGLSMDIPDAPKEGGFVITKGITVLSHRFPHELSIVTEGNGKGYIAGEEIPCWYHMEHIP
jgi:hypothetical protein